MKTFFLLLPVLLASAAAAQVDHASSESHVAITPGFTGVAGLVSGSTLDARVELPLVVQGATLTSPKYVAHLGSAGIPAELPPGAPLVFGALPASGGKDGGEPLTVVGFGFGDVAATATLHLGGSPATGVSVATNTVLHAVSGPGLNVHGNPLGRVDVQVTNPAGKGICNDAYLYAPALDDAAAPRVGQEYLLDVHLPAGSFYQLVLGGSIPGVAIPVAPLQGAAEVLTGLIQLTGLELAVLDLVTLPLPIPDHPALIGVQLELQAAVLTGLAPLAGTFTNRLAATVQP